MDTLGPDNLDIILLLGKMYCHGLVGSTELVLREYKRNTALLTEKEREVSFVNKSPTV